MLNACPTRAREDGCKQNMLGKKKKGARKSVCTMWIASPTRARKMDANRPASVPVTLTAPSVPRGTIDRVVTKYLSPHPTKTQIGTPSLFGKRCIPFVTSSLQPAREGGTPLFSLLKFKEIHVSSIVIENKRI
jgi:hypothetical protein